MEPTRLATHVAHGRDQELAAALRGARAMPGSGRPVLVAFRNERGEMYRFALLHGPAQVRYLRVRLVQLHLLASLHEEDGLLAVLGNA
jgi:plasmid stabilization system protein ParE